MIEIPQWLHEVNPDILPEQHRKLANVIGYEKMLALVANFSGDYLYVPKLDAIIKAVRDTQLAADFAKGMSHKELGHKYDLSLSHVYVILNRAKGGQIDGQVSLFEQAGGI